MTNRDNIAVGPGTDAISRLTLLQLIYGLSPEELVRVQAGGAYNNNFYPFAAIPCPEQ